MPVSNARDANAVDIPSATPDTLRVPETLAQWLRRKRREKDLSQERLAQELGVSRSTTGRWEKNDEPQPEHRDLLRAYFGEDPPQGRRKPSVEDRLASVDEKLDDQSERLDRTNEALNEVLKLLKRRHDG